MGRKKLPPSEKRHPVIIFAKKKYHKQVKAEIEALVKRYELEELIKSKNEKDGTKTIHG